ncbi:MAG: hypothetical protein HON70_19760, partial [Lentisphaerae bacterium]|nr:hypothetical protein [Lentisphaerota bacterium]
PFAVAVPDVRPADYERLVVRRNDHGVTRALTPLVLLDAHRAVMVDASGAPPPDARLLELARVAGVDNALYGLPETTRPALAEWAFENNGVLLWSATVIGDFYRRRYGPSRHWEQLLAGILQYLTPHASRADMFSRQIQLHATLQPSVWADIDQPVTLQVTACPEVEIRIAAAGVEHAAAIPASGCLDIPLSLPSGEHRITVTATRGENSIQRVLPLSICPRTTFHARTVTTNLEWYREAGMLIAPDGGAGVLEGLQGLVDIEGRQKPCSHEGKPNERTDCNLQSALAFKAAGNVLQSADFAAVGDNLFRFTRENFQFRDSSIRNGFWRWFRHGYASEVFYSDDGGWAGLLSLVKGLMDADDKALESGLHTAEATRATWGRNGHRRTRIDRPYFDDMDGRRGFREENVTKPQYRSPHYEAPSMALMGLASWITGRRDFVDCCTPGIEDYLTTWPEDIMFQHGESDDTAKLVIALLFVGAGSGDERWTREARDLLEPFLERQLPSGAIPEFDRPGQRYGRVRENARYGTFESSLFQVDEDLICDQLYGSSFLALAFSLARWFIPGDHNVVGACGRLLDFLARIQVRDMGDPLLDGAWMRSYDTRKGEYYGEAGDWGWGPFAVETGWMCSIIDLALIWNLSETPPFPFPDDITRERWQPESLRIRTEHDELEGHWRETTPPPIPLTPEPDEPDLRG